MEPEQPEQPETKTRRRGPYKFTKQKQEAFLAALREGSRRGAAAESVGVTRWLISHYIKSNPEFREAIERAEMEANELVEDALFMAATSGNVVAAQVWLYNRAPDRWRDQRNVNHEHTIKVDEAAKRLALEYDAPEDAVRAELLDLEAERKRRRTA